MSNWEFAFRARRVALGLSAGAVLLLTGSSAWAQRKPIVLVFAASVEPTGVGVGVKKEGADGLTPDARTAAGTRALCSCLDDSNALLAVRYDPKLSMVVRAETEANLHIANPSDPTSAERVQIAKAMGSVYVIAVSTQAPAGVTSGGENIDMTVEGVDIEKNKTYTDHVRMSSRDLGRPIATPTSNGVISGTGDDGVRHFSGVDQLDNVLLSAANTLVTRILAGPLHDYSRTAPPAQFLPSAPAGAPGNASDASRLHPTGTAVHENAAPTAVASAGAAPNIPTIPVDGAPLVPGDSRFGVANTSTPLNIRTTKIPTKIVLPAPTTAAGAVGGDSDAYARAAQSGGKMDEMTQLAMQQSTAFLNDGDSDAAIMTLRGAIDQQPLSPSLRLALAQAYFTAHRNVEAEGEARRALTVVPTITPDVQTELTGILNKSIVASGDTDGARATYERIVTAQPAAYWARVALAGLDATEGRGEEAEAQYRTVLQADPSNGGAVTGMTRLLVERGDLAEAQKTLGASGVGSVRSVAAIAVFDAVTRRIAERMTKNRASFDALDPQNAEQDQARKAIFNATTAQTTRIADMVTLLKANPPTAGDALAERAFKRRLYAATLLAQAATDLTSLIQTADADAGADSRIQLLEFDKSLTQAQGQAPGQTQTTP